MNSNLKNKDTLFDFIRENYLLAKKDIPENFKSTHVDFQNSLEETQFSRSTKQGKCNINRQWAKIVPFV